MLDAPQLITVIASVDGNPEMTAKTTLRVTPSLLSNPATVITSEERARVSVSPLSTTVLAGGVQPFAARDSTGQTVGARWSVLPLVGSISPDGVYVAPADIGTARTVVVLAQPNATPDKTLASVVTVAPAAPELAAFRCQLRSTSVLCTITLSAPAPAEGTHVTATVTDGTRAVLPLDWYIAGGLLTGNEVVDVNEPVSITATLGTTIMVRLAP